MRADILFSGSSGNATLVRSGSDAILIDCGKSARTLCLALKEAGSDICRIAAVFITHEHTDHTSALNVMCSKNEIPVHVTEKSAVKLRRQENTARRLVVHPETFEEKVGSFTVRSFPVPHDSDGCVGYVIEDSQGDTLGIVTDVGHVTGAVENSLKKCRRVIIESNHDEEMLKCGPYPFDLKLRILSPRGHLSNEECSLLACRLAECGCEAFALAHISDDNNTHEIAYTETRRALDSAGFPDCEITVTYKDSAVTLPDGIKKTETGAGTNA